MDDRTRDLLIDSSSVGTTWMRVLLPVGFDTDPNRRWPVLYLLQGANDPDTYKSWTRSTDVAALTAGLPLLVVMPEGGIQGYGVVNLSGGLIAFRRDVSIWFDRGPRERGAVIEPGCGVLPGVSLLGGDHLPLVRPVERIG